MFSKLLKHELKSQFRTICILSLAVLGVALACFLLTWFLFSVINGKPNDTMLAFSVLFIVLSIIGSVVVHIAYSIGVTILLLVRFYRHLFSDEGYLTFTLPVTTHQILLSNILSIVILTLASSVVSVLGMVLVFSPAISYTTQALRDVPFDLIFEDLSMIDTKYLWIQIISFISTSVYSLILPLLSITIGCQVAKKHKLLASFGIGYGLSAAVSFISGIISVVSLLGDMAVSVATEDIIYIFTILIPSLLYLGIGIGGYFVMHHLVTKKLNLP